MVFPFVPSFRTRRSTQAIGRCPVCARDVGAADAHLRVRGMVFHRGCAGYRARTWGR
ncbi:MAG TPA: hypothetical protein VNT32_15480 [Thermoleophilaceae bacterium]|nr:hypothetical protein [Thermoleophilaceae bacterium]